MLKKILYLVLFLSVIAATVAYWGYATIFVSNTAFDSETYSIEIPDEAGFDTVKKILESDSILSDISSFEKVAGWMNYDKKKVPSGRYIIHKGWNNREIIGLLRSGRQEPIKVTFNNVRNIEQLMGEISKGISLDSISLTRYFTKETVIKELGYNKENFMSLFIPNTYNLYWNITPEKIGQRMKKEHTSFWSKKNRLSKAEKLGLTKNEIYTLASIVEKESQHGPERSTIAGLYLNRLKRGQLLQADPTVVYATGNFNLRRVLNKHLEIDSPYNTYKNIGLPPGPIYMPSIQSIDAVLNPKKHSYLYMCAKPGYGTQHAFAKTLKGHNKNANTYRRWLSEEGIR